jgi:hypothetical protein
VMNGAFAGRARHARITDQSRAARHEGSID